MRGRAEASTYPERLRRTLPDFVGVVCVLAAAAAVLLPALVHGRYLGSFDWVSQYGLSQRSGVVVHDRRSFDSITEFIPWANLAWTQVHHGQLPLWNPYTVLGTPLTFNWQAGTFGLPALVGYLFPLSLAYTAQVVVTLVVAGTGAYVFGRVLGVGVLGCVLAGVVYELSGPFVGWIGSPISSVMSWAGWLFAAAVVVLRPRRPARAVAVFSVVLAAAIYGGQPDTLINVGSALLVFVAALLVVRARRHGPRSIVGPARRVVSGVVGGAVLSAPLLIPGLQLLPQSMRAGKNLSQAVPLPSAVLVLFQGYDGLPVAGSHWFGPGPYTRTAVYVGVITCVLAIVAVAAAVKLRHRVAAVGALTAVAVVMAVIVYVPVVESLLDGVPLVGTAQWRRSTTAMAFALAVLAGLGADALVRLYRQRVVRTWAVGAFSLAAVVLLGMWLFGRGTLDGTEAGIRAHSFIWPAACTVLGLAACAVLVWAARRRPVPAHGAHGAHGAPGGASGGRAAWWAVAALVAGEAGFLVGAGAPLLSSSPTYLAPTAAEATLSRAVGSSLVAFGDNTCFSTQLGIVPNYNVALHVQEFAAYEPLLPKSYGDSWRTYTGGLAAPVQKPIVPFSTFCPAVTTVADARLYGIAYVLEPQGRRGPAGSVFVLRVGHEGLYRIPGAGPATLTPLGTDGATPGTSAPGTTVPVTRPDATTWRLTTDSRSPQELRLRLTDAPGWHATIDGRPLALEHFAGVMLQARIPPGRHHITVTYWPGTFSAGLALGGVGAVVLVAAVMVESRRIRRRRSYPGENEEAADRLGPNGVGGSIAPQD